MSESLQPETPRARLGIGGRLGLAFGLSALFAVLAGVISWLAFERVSGSIRAIGEGQLPVVISAGQLAQLGGAITAGAPLLSRAESSAEVEEIGNRLRERAGALRQLGDDGVLAMVCDSTNVFVDGRAGSEADVREELIRVIAAQTGRVAVACFASNVARMETAIVAGRAAGRKICLVGRSMIRMAAAARHVGMDVDSQGFISEAQASHLPPEQVLLLCTGSQGEPRAALSRIADGSHPHIRLGAGDAVIFSSRVIPGNEIAIRDMQNRLSERGIRLITDREHPGIHVSGHPCRDELADMYAWARPQISIPTHGERRHLLEHAAFARDLQVPQAVAPRNGDMVRLAPGRAEVIDEVPAGRIYIDGGFLTPQDGEPLRERRHAATSGVLHAALVLDGRGRIASGPQVRAIGLPGEPERPLDDILDDLADTAEAAVRRLDGDQREIDAEVEAAISRALKKAAQRIWGRRPVVQTALLRL